MIRARKAGAWEEAAVKVRQGGAWVDAVLNHRAGTAWVPHEAELPPTGGGASYTPVRAQSFYRAGAYPINSTFTVDTTGLTGAVIFFSCGSGDIPNTPTVKVGTATATYLGKCFSTSTGCVLAWKILAPPQGAATSLSIVQLNTYADLSVLSIAGFNDATDFSLVEAEAGGTAVTVGGTMPSGAGGLISCAMAHYTGGNLSLTGSSPAGATVIHTHTPANSNHPHKLAHVLTGSSPSASHSWSVPYNQVNGIAVAVHG